MATQEIAYHRFSTLRENYYAFNNVTSPSDLIIAYIVLFAMPKPENKKNCGIFTTSESKTYQVGESCALPGGIDRYTPLEIPELKGKDVNRFCISPRHAAVLLDDGSVYTWGANEVGQLGHGDETPLSRPKKVVTDTKFSKVQCAASATLGLAKNGDIYQWGQLNPRSNEKYTTPHKCGLNAEAIYVGAHHAGATLHNKPGPFRQLHTWGLGADGRLGHGNEDDVSCDKPKKLPMNIEDASLATRSTAIVDDGFKVRVFGKNYGNLKVKAGPKILTPTVVKKVGEDVETVAGSWTDDFYIADNEDDEQFIFGDRIAADDPDADKEGTASKGAPPKKLKNRLKF